METLSFVTVASFETAPSAWILSNHLTHLGLDPIIVDEHTVNTNWLYSAAIGGVKVQLPASQIAEFESIRNEVTSIDFPDFVENTAPDSTTCVECGSIEIYSKEWPKRLIFLTWLATGFPIPIYAKTTKCSDCGFEKRPKFGMPLHFRIVHLLVLTTLIATMLGMSTILGFDWLRLIAAPNRP